MHDWKKSLVGADASLRNAIQAINDAATQIALIVDDQMRLLGTLSDGDVRRALLGGATLETPVNTIMHKNPTVARISDDRAARLEIMHRKVIHQLPIVDTDGIIIGLEVIDEFLGKPDRTEWVVIMAGGPGSRLKELTRDKPKPMLDVGPRPLLESIVGAFSSQGFRNIYLAVNYKAEQIEEHFGDGKNFGVDIQYLREQDRLGTAGPLSLLPSTPTEPIIVTNADLLTREDFGFMLDRHTQCQAQATMAVREYEIQVPFGVVCIDDEKISGIEEKPIQRFLVSAGMYVLAPEVVELVPKNTYFDMPALFEEVIRRGYHTRYHLVDGYWLDIGRPDDYHRANDEYHKVFR
ncbi:nucleotidyltransferase family protein [Sedimenticola sp.]|uniref:nucleotidyltransferase family protein n=1 Tax=Sedimenticola sp. TaxID=1940285 RepID=UPI003D0E6664